MIIDVADEIITIAVKFVIKRVTAKVATEFFINSPLNYFAAFIAFSCFHVYAADFTDGHKLFPEQFVSIRANLCLFNYKQVKNYSSYQTPAFAPQSF